MKTGLKRNGFFIRLYAGILAATWLTAAIVITVMALKITENKQKSYEQEVEQQASEISGYLSEINRFNHMWQNQTIMNLLNRKLISIESSNHATVWIVTYEDGNVRYMDSSWEISEQISDPKVLKQLMYIYDNGRIIHVQGLFKELGSDIVTIGVPWKYDNTVVGAVLLNVSVDQLRVHASDIVPSILLGFGFASIFGIIVAAVIAHVQAEPIRRIRNAVEKFSKGDFASRVEMKKGSQEIRDLADSIDHMAEELSELEESRKAFVSNVSHELRSPLTCMQGYINGMLDGTIPPEETQHYMQVVSDETKRLTNLVSDLLKLSRYESGKMPLNKTRFDINEMMRVCIISFGARLEEKDVDVEVDFAQDTCYALADQDRITQVIRNLMDNAIKFLPKEGGRLDIGVALNGKLVTVSIKDNGSGISEADMPHIFDRFYTADKAHTSGQGTGLGLSIVKRIIADHGQEISCVSKEGEGTCFTFTLEADKDQSVRRPEPNLQMSE